MTYAGWRPIKRLSTTLLAIIVGAPGALANDYADCVQAGELHSQLRLAMQASNGCAGQPEDASERAQETYNATPRGQACQQARRLCGMKPEVGLRYCERFLRSGLGSPDEIALANRITEALDTAYARCPAQ